VGAGFGSAEAEWRLVLMVVNVLVFQARWLWLMTNVLLDSGLESRVDAEFSAGLGVSGVVLMVAVVVIASESAVVGLICAEVVWFGELWIRWHWSFLLLW
jgi:hypothetical protein